MGSYAWAKPYFKDRGEAARLLSEKLSDHRGENPLVLAIPRGAVPMGRIIAEALNGELDLALVHKVGAPDNPELAVGAVGEGGEFYPAPHLSAFSIPEKELKTEIEKQKNRLQEQRKLYTPHRPPLDAQGRVVILVDDGIATGSTILAAIRELRHQAPTKVIVATAVAPPDIVEQLRREADDIIILSMESDFGAVGEFFEDFSQVTDDQVVRILQGTGSPRNGQGVGKKK